MSWLSRLFGKLPADESDLPKVKREFWRARARQERLQQALDRYISDEARRVEELVRAKS